MNNFTKSFTMNNNLLLCQFMKQRNKLFAVQRIAPMDW